MSIFIGGLKYSQSSAIHSLLWPLTPANWGSTVLLLDEKPLFNDLNNLQQGCTNTTTGFGLIPF